jgi:predicted proteasome-type protease
LRYYKTVLAQSYLYDSNLESEADKQKLYDDFLDKIDVTAANNNLYVGIPLNMDLINLHEQNLSLHKKDQYESKDGYCLFSFMKTHFDTLFIMDGFGRQKSFDLKAYRNELEQKAYKFFIK